MFINPMWDNEAQRIGKQRCTPLGYKLHVASDLIGFVALILLIGVCGYLIYSGIRGTFTQSRLWLLAAPFGLAVVDDVLHRFSWHLAARKQFNYDYDTRTSTWVDDSGTARSYKYGDTDTPGENG